MLVPSLAGYTTHPFCVAKYEMKNTGGAATSQALGTRWHSISRNNSITECSNVGSDYALMTNDEWQTVARNIEGVSSNWGGGTVGNTLGLSIGNSVSPSQPASENDNEPCTGITLGGGDTCDSKNWHVNRRTFTLSNQQVVWDLAGNVWEWMKDDNDQNYGSDEQIALLKVATHSVTHALSGGTTTTSRDAKAQFGPAGDYSATLTIRTLGEV